MKRINVIGSSGSSKSTFARSLARALNLPYVEMDALFWRENWTPCPEEEFLQILENNLQKDAWVLDGNYSRTTKQKWKHATTVIWLDFSFLTTMRRSISRAISRSIKRQELWPETGNRESFRKSFFSRDSIVLWSLTNYTRVRRKYLTLLKSPDWPHIEFIHLKTPSEAEQFLESLLSKSYADPVLPEK